MIWRQSVALAAGPLLHIPDERRGWAHVVTTSVVQKSGAGIPKAVYCSLHLQVTASIALVLNRMGIRDVERGGLLHGQ